MLLRDRRSSAFRRPHRPLRMEALEGRNMLSLAAVAAVEIGSTQWSSAFVDYLESAGFGTEGYAIPVGSASQLQTLPWTNLDQIRIRFTEDVDVQASDLSVSGVNTTAYAFSNFAYDANGYTAVWTLAQALTKDKLLIDLDADGLDPIRSVAGGQILDGEWTDCQSTYDSGDGYEGTDFQFRFNVLPGDADANNGVNLIDATLVRGQIGKNAGDTGYGIRYDLDGSGGIAWNDYYAARAELGDTLPSGDPAGLSNDAPTTAGICDVTVNQNAADYVIQLFDAFDDAEDDDDDLTYSVVGNTNPSLFDSWDIDAYGGLTLDFAADAYDGADLTIRATDSQGLFVETTFSVYVNAAPVITDFIGTAGYDDYWTFGGRVSDPDDVVEGMTVILGGVLDGYGAIAVVQADGTFSVTWQFVGLQTGTATARTFDWHGAESNLAEYWITVP